MHIRRVCTQVKPCKTYVAVALQHAASGAIQGIEPLKVVTIVSSVLPRRWSTAISFAFVSQRASAIMLIHHVMFGQVGAKLPRPAFAICINMQGLHTVLCHVSFQTHLLLFMVRNYLKLWILDMILGLWIVNKRSAWFSIIFTVNGLGDLLLCIELVIRSLSHYINTVN